MQGAGLNKVKFCGWNSLVGYDKWFSSLHCDRRRLRPSAAHKLWRIAEKQGIEERSERMVGMLPTKGGIRVGFLEGGP